jgi:phage-related protein
MKVVRWMGSSLKDVRSFPESVRKEIGRALFTAQMGGIDLAAKPLQGFGGAGVVEIVASFRSDTYRAVYTVRFGDAVYVLHAFQKKSKRGIATPQADRELIRKRLADARAHHARSEK